MPRTSTSWCPPPAAARPPRRSPARREPPGQAAVGNFEDSRGLGVGEPRELRSRSWAWSSGSTRPPGKTQLSAAKTRRLVRRSISTCRCGPVVEQHDGGRRSDGTWSGSKSAWSVTEATVVVTCQNRPMPRLTERELTDFLDEPGLLLRLATIDDSGMPRISPVWFVYQDGAIVFTPRARSVFLANLRRDPRVRGRGRRGCIALSQGQRAGSGRGALRRRQRRRMAGHLPTDCSALHPRRRSRAVHPGHHRPAGAR